MNKSMIFIGCYAFSYALSKLALWIVKDHYTKPPRTSLKNILYLQCILLIAALFYIFVTSHSYTSPTLYGYGVYGALVALTIFTDLYAMLIATSATAYCAPLGWIAAACGLIPLTITESLTGTGIALIMAQGLYYLFFKLLKQEGIGRGDIDFLILVGTWTGPQGFWMTLSVGSYLATIYGVTYWCIYRTKHFKLPFATFLGFATLIYIAFDQYKNLFKIIGITLPF